MKIKKVIAKLMDAEIAFEDWCEQEAKEDWTLRGIYTETPQAKNRREVQKQLSDIRKRLEKSLEDFEARVIPE